MIPLKSMLVINSTSSGATGLGLILASKLVAGIFGITEPQPFVIVGAFLAVFAMLVFVVSRRDPMSSIGVQLIIAGDILWVLASVVIVLFQLFGLSLIGYTIICAVALWVGTMAYLQFNGLRSF